MQPRGVGRLQSAFGSEPRIQARGRCTQVAAGGLLAGLNTSPALALVALHANAPGYYATDDRRAARKWRTIRRTSDNSTDDGWRVCPRICEGVSSAPASDQRLDSASQVRESPVNFPPSPNSWSLSRISCLRRRSSEVGREERSAEASLSSGSVAGPKSRRPLSTSRLVRTRRPKSSDSSIATRTLSMAEPTRPSSWPRATVAISTRVCSSAETKSGSRIHRWTVERAIPKSDATLDIGVPTTTAWRTRALFAGRSTNPTTVSICRMVNHHTNPMSDNQMQPLRQRQNPGFRRERGKTAIDAATAVTIPVWVINDN